MHRSFPAALALLTLVAACDATGGSTGPVTDPSPQATLGESINSPTDGAQNEISVD